MKRLYNNIIKEFGNNKDLKIQFEVFKKSKKICDIWISKNGMDNRIHVSKSINVYCIDTYKNDEQIGRPDDCTCDIKEAIEIIKANIELIKKGVA